MPTNLGALPLDDLRARFHRRRTVHAGTSRALLIYRPTAADRLIYGRSASYHHALAVLRRAAGADAVLMARLRRVAGDKQAHPFSQNQIVEGVARDVAQGRMILCAEGEPAKPNVDRYAAAHDAGYLEALSGFESAIPHMYLDSQHVVTVGIGAQVFSEDDAAKMKFIHRRNGSIADDTAKKDEFNKLNKNPKYRLLRDAQAFRSVTELDLAPGEAVRIRDIRLQAAEDDARKLFAAWDTFPLPAQLALLDMSYNMGPGRELTPAEVARHVHGGLTMFHNLRAKVAGRDWIGVATSNECHRADVQESRNKWTRQKFVEAAHLDPPRPDPDRALKF